MGNRVVWFEVLGDDAENLRSFYGDLFDWKFNVYEQMNYGTTMPSGDDSGIGGGIGAGEGGVKWAIFYIQVKDINETLKAVEAKGGKVLVPRTPIPDMVTFAVFEDPEGNKVGLVEDM